MAEPTEDAATEKTRKRAERLESLIDTLLDDFETAFANGTATATDRSTLIRWIKDSGFDLDPKRIPAKLKDKLTAKLPAAEVDADEAEPRHLRAI